MKVSQLARLLMVAGTLQMVGVGCSDDPVVGSRDAAPDVAADKVTPEDQVEPEDIVQPEDRPDVATDTATEDTATDTAPDTVTEDTPGDTTPDVVTDTADDATPDVPVGDVGADTVTEDATTDAPTDTPTDTAGCTSSMDCVSSMGGPVCDTATRTCVACTATEDVCAVGNYCSMNRCVPGCRSTADCMGSMRCDTTTHMCVGCSADGDCALGTICRVGTCVPGCATGRACGAGSTCCGTSCVNTVSDNANCGACGTACATGTTCCASACVNPQTSATNCGGCGMTCTVANATATCAAGACGVGTCNAGFANCDGMAANGCETNTNTTATACGSCGTTCPAATNATPSCAGGSCGIDCNTGFANCDTMTGNGCEVNTATSAANCGRCGNACAAPTNAVATCTAGACAFTCSTGFGNCDGIATNGCEVNLTSSATHCGACGSACAPPNSTGACSAGACTVGVCNAGFGNCDGMVGNGCETTTRTDHDNCGACGNRCSPSAICFDGACRDLCTAPLSVCGTTCVNTANDNSNCGRCGAVCGTVSNATNTCTAGACAVSCNRGFGNCDGAASNGCEAVLTADVVNCGTCGTTCSFANAASACTNGACAMGACNAGFADCDGNPTNGCEVDTRTNLTSCGACGRTCSFANAAATCAAGSCGLGACNAGWANCDGVATNGCEVNTNTSSLHCGSCGGACAAGQACLAGTCVSACPVGTTFCTGACVNTNTSNAHCGVCARVCATGQSCVSGACTALAPVNDTISGALPINLSTASTDFTANTTSAVHNAAVPCLGTGVNTGRDVFYRFTLTRREYVYADTFGSSYDTVLFFLNSAGAAITTQTAGDLVCNDDIGGTCTGGGLNSRVFTLLGPGNYFLAVSGYATSAGASSIHFEHVPAGSGVVATLPSGSSTLTGVTSTGTAGTLTSGACGGAGPENSYWWVTCPGTGTSTALTAETCGTAAFDTVLYLNTGSGFTACNDDSCDRQSRLSASYSLATRVHALYIDGFTTSSGGAYTLRVVRP